jgi:flagellar motor switch protein FliM
VSTPSQNPVETPAATPPAPEMAPGKSRTIYNCNFRMAGRLSNEDARSLTRIHEIFAHRAANALDEHLGAGAGMKLGTLDQITVKDHVAEVPALIYIVPFASGMMTMELSVDLVFPIIEMLMGGTGDAKSAERDLSEIEEEVMQEIVMLIARHLGAVWAIPDFSMIPGQRIKVDQMFQTLRASEKLVILRFETTIGTATGSLNVALAKPILDLLLKRIKENQPQSKPKVWSFPAPPLRERILDCETEVIAELPELRIAVKDLVTLQPGSVLKLRAPIRMPGMLTAGGRSLFEVVPVRSGTQRAAQLGRRTLESEWKRR